MEDRMMKFYSKESNMLALHAMHGHFATSHSHINYYVDVVIQVLLLLHFHLQIHNTSMQYQNM